MARTIIGKEDDYNISYMFLNALTVSLETGEGALSLPARRATHS